ncbi:unnamed protein product [Nezara viridula]|uniref:Uncharacterized protein n=1 Tax=Nezara viridula TaxID=85310 RepID=A0A9P0H3U9_NEZVI|nr:unnamed protein product [Nezara viridula]
MQHVSPLNKSTKVGNLGRSPPNFLEQLDLLASL